MLSTPRPKQRLPQDPSTLDAGVGHAFDEIALEERISDDDRKRQECRSSELHAELRFGLSADDKNRDKLRERHQRSITNNNQRPEHLIPARHKCEDGHGDDDWSRKRPDDVEDNSELRTAVYSRGIDECLRQAKKKLPEQDNAKCAHHRRRDEREIRIRQTELHHQDVLRNQGDLKRNHHREDNEEI